MGLTGLQALPCTGWPASPSCRRTQPPPGSLGCGGAGPGGERGEPPPWARRSRLLRPRGCRRRQLQEGAGRRVGPCRTAPPRGGGRWAEGRWKRCAEGGCDRQPLPVRWLPRTSVRGCTSLPGSGWAAPANLCGEGGVGSGRTGR